MRFTFIHILGCMNNILKFSRKQCIIYKTNRHADIEVIPTVEENKIGQSDPINNFIQSKQTLKL